MVLKSQIDAGSDPFKENKTSLKERLQQLRRLLKENETAGRKARPDALSVRRRIEALKDPDTEFLELSPLAALQVYDTFCPGAGLVTGIAKIEGRSCMIIANNPTVKGGSYFPLTVKKHLRAQEIALENRLPCFYLVDSGGAYLPLQSEVFPDKEHFGRIFYNQARLSARGIAQIAVILGSCVAGGAYIPALADENIIVKGRGTVFLGGPALVKSATGEITDKEALGGGDLHCRISGLCDHLSFSEQEALQKARSIAKGLPKSPEIFYEEDPAPPLYPEEELYGLLPKDLKTPFLMKEVLARLLDKSELDEFKAEYGKTLITGWGRILGRRVGVVAGNGPFFSESAAKGAHFIDLSSKRGTPLVFFQNIPGFMVGRKYEERGIAKHGANMVKAVALARVPKFTVLAGGSFGAGNYGLCGRAFQGRFLWSWPSSRIAVMGGGQAEETLKTTSKSGSKWDALQQYQKESDPLYATARLWDDGLIDPLDTRKILSLALSLTGRLEPAADAHPLYRM